MQQNFNFKKLLLKIIYFTIIVGFKIETSEEAKSFFEVLSFFKRRCFLYI